jgi:hypothetical protein
MADDVLSRVDFQRLRVLARARAGDQLSRTELRLLVDVLDELHSIAERALDGWRAWSHGDVSDEELFNLEPEQARLRSTVTAYARGNG